MVIKTFFLFKLTKSWHLKINVAILATSRIEIIIRCTSRFSVRKVLIDCTYKFQHHRPALNTPHITWSMVIFIGARSSRNRRNMFELMIVNKKKICGRITTIVVIEFRLVAANHSKGIVSPPLWYKPRVFHEQLYGVKRYECPRD